ncbi:C4-dicarboxylate ABC transporter [Williamsia sp. MIQD14]|uniref:SLAC1 family transporter n=1 Tax=Williamsia sp. MIQD14 TaxID=3425703 RepID=UPI003DA1B46B
MTAPLITFPTPSTAVASTTARLAHITPNWFTTVMGTGIVAVAAAELPIDGPGIRVLGTAMWLLSVVVFLAVSTAFALHWSRHRGCARAYARHETLAHFYGAPAMAAMTVGAGTLLHAAPIMGSTGALLADAVLWTAGTAAGVVTLLVVGAGSLRRPGRGGPAAPTRMMSVVAPMVSASTGALLAAHIADAAAAHLILVISVIMFAASLVAGGATAVAVVGRMVRVGGPRGAAAPTVWIPLGMMGQSVTAAVALGAAYDTSAVHALALGAGGVFAGLAAVTIAVAITVTAGAARRGLPFSMTWWSFTFPVGTCVTGASALGKATGFRALDDIAVIGFVILFAAWAVVATRTITAVSRGDLPAAP